MPDGCGSKDSEIDVEIDVEIDWKTALSSPGLQHVVTLRQLHPLMVRAAGHQVWRMRAALPDASPGGVDVIVNQAAYEALRALLG